MTGQDLARISLPRLLAWLSGADRLPWTVERREAWWRVRHAEPWLLARALVVCGYAVEPAGVMGDTLRAAAQVLLELGPSFEFRRGGHRLAPAPSGDLFVGDELSWLPLLDLAADVARQQGGLAVVPVGDLPGRYGEYDSGARTVYLLAQRSPGDLQVTWAHELSHVVDPKLQARPWDRREDFADRLGPVLLARRPMSLAEAEPEIRVADWWASRGNPSPASGSDLVTAALWLAFAPLDDEEAEG